MKKLSCPNYGWHKNCGEVCRRRGQRDENLMLGTAVEQYAQKYSIPTATFFLLFRQYDITVAMRQYYNALHTQPLEECFYFRRKLYLCK